MTSKYILNLSCYSGVGKESKESRYVERAKSLRKSTIPKLTRSLRQPFVISVSENVAMALSYYSSALHMLHASHMTNDAHKLL